MNYAPEFAGVGRYSGEVAEYLASRGHQVAVVTTPAHYPGWEVQEPYAGGRFYFERRNNVDIFRCPLLLRRQMGGVWRLLAPLTFALTSAPVAFWQILRRKPDIVMLVVPTLFSAPVLLLGAHLMRARTVVHMQDLEVDAAFAVGHLARWGWLKRCGELFERTVLPMFGQVITISDKMAEKISLKGVPRSKIEVVRNWVDLDQIKPLDTVSQYRVELGIEQDEFVVLYSGNIGRKQGLGILLDAAELSVDQPKIKFVVVGDGPSKAELMARYGHLESVRFLPFQPGERMSELLGLADLHALPQEADAADLVLPSKLGGMLASSKPIVAMAESGTEIARFLSDTVTLIPPGDSLKLADAIRTAFQQKVVDVAGVTKRRRLAQSITKRESLPRFVEAVFGRRALQ